MQAQELRHAATHRFPLAHLGRQDIAGTEALVPITVHRAIKATRHALSIARSAFLYVVATLDVLESRKHEATGTPMLLPYQREVRPDPGAR